MSVRQRWVAIAAMSCATFAGGLACSPSGTLPARDSGSDRATPPPVPDGSPPRDSGPLADGAPPGCDPFRVGEDQDGDGFVGGLDCDDCSAAANPGAFDFPGNDADEDCDGADDTVSRCDEGLALDSSSPGDAARAIGLCQTTTEDGDEWGVIDARYTRPDGTGAPSDGAQHGLASSFGETTPREGSAMLVLSSGVARAPDQAGWTSGCDFFQDPDLDLPAPFPEGFPVESPSCPGVVTGPAYDAVALEVRIRVPTNARSFSFVSNFYTYEYPEFICSEFNDYFVALLQPRPSGLENDNIVFDDMGNVISVNNSLLDVCTGGSFGGKTFTCPEGTELLRGTGFGAEEALCADDPDAPYPGHGRAATGWLETTAPVTPGSVITLRFGIWDSGDSDLDSSVILDSFEWDVEEAPVRTTPGLF